MLVLRARADLSGRQRDTIILQVVATNPGDHPQQLGIGGCGAVRVYTT